MGAINLPYQIENGDGLDADTAMANWIQIVNVANGLLEASSNVRVAAPSASNAGNANSEGTSASLSRSDHAHVIQGVENVTAAPSIGNFEGRLVFDTSSGQLLMCTDAVAPTFIAVGNLVATDLVAHGAQHKDAGDDPLPDNTLTDHMFAAKANIFTAELTSAHSGISSSSYSTIIDLSVTTTGQQTLGVAVNIRFQNGAAAQRLAAFRVVDVTNSNTTIFKSIQHQLGTSGGGSDAAWLSAHFYYTTPATGSRTLRLQAGADGATVNVSGSGTFNGDATADVTPTLQAVIL